jgi:hypothetical protein
MPTCDFCGHVLALSGACLRCQPVNLAAMSASALRTLALSEPSELVRADILRLACAIEHRDAILAERPRGA